MDKTLLSMTNHNLNMAAHSLREINYAMASIQFATSSFDSMHIAFQFFSQCCLLDNLHK